MLPACRPSGDGFAIPTFDLVPSDVEGFMEELWEFQSAFHDCFARSEPRVHFFQRAGKRLKSIQVPAFQCCEQERSFFFERAVRMSLRRWMAST
jgi:hypothetical protein